MLTIEEAQAAADNLDRWPPGIGGRWMDNYDIILDMGTCQCDYAMKYG